MNKEHYLNYAVWNKVEFGSIKPTLIKVGNGHFASRAWKISDEAYYQVAGTKFGGIFGDDASESWVSKFNVRRLESDEEFEQLYNSSCLHFKILLKVLDLLDRMRDEMTDHVAKIHAYQVTVDFKGYAVNWFEGLKLTEMPSDEELQMIAKCVLARD